MAGEASTTEPPPAAARDPWYADWQDREHARHFDFRSAFPDNALVRNYESFNDVRLLGEFLAAGRSASLLEVGCATGEFYRYLSVRHPAVRYAGVDVSEPALERARQKYRSGAFYRVDPNLPLRQELRKLGLAERADVVYSKDVLHHQTDPWGFLSRLLETASGAVILRTRTRNAGATVLDPDLSCQYHYRGWMPYLVLNFEELKRRIRAQAPGCRIRTIRHPMILGGKENRYLPKECYLQETGTAETAVAVFLRDGPEKETDEERGEVLPPSPLRHRLSSRLRRVFRS